MMPVDLAKFIS